MIVRPPAYGFLPSEFEISMNRCDGSSGRCCGAKLAAWQLGDRPNKRDLKV